MYRLFTYVLRQLAGPIGLFIFLLTSVVWLSQSLRLLDLVINRGQSALTFFYLTLLMLPNLLVIVLPIAFFAGTLYALHKLNADSELTVMSSSGCSPAQLLAPVLAASAVVMLATCACSLYLMPFCQRLMRDKEVDIRGDIAAAILNEGQFNTPSVGLTVFMRELSPDGQLRGVLVHDERDRLRPTTYLAERGIIAASAAGARLIMLDGTIEQGTVQGACRHGPPPHPKPTPTTKAAAAKSLGTGPKCQTSGFAPPSLSVLKFKRYVFDLDQFAGRPQESELRTSERYLSELLWPVSSKPLKRESRNIYFAEANNRLSAALYCPAFALIAFAAVTLGRHARGAYALRLATASLGAAALRIAGYGIQGIAARNPLFCILFYVIPFAAGAAALADIAGFDWRRFVTQLRSRVWAPAS
ncbi:MAG TPA: LptF/LptG family permease [Rhizomicrobium sp.]|jgi:lipopolysaccharide export system permease protein|nr:LptF/LptG family permease [Rhizomicrobium sp.]